MFKLGSRILLTLTILIITAVYVSLLMVQQAGRKPSQGNSSNIEEYFETVPLERLEIKFFGWVTPDDESINSFSRNADKFTWVSPTGSIIDANGVFIPKVDSRIVEAARRSNVSIVPLVANSGFDRSLVHRILTDPEAGKRTMESIVGFVIEKNFSGVNIDYENIPPEDRDALNSYMRELASRLHSHGKIVTIDVSGKTRDDTSGGVEHGTTGLWVKSATMFA